MCSGSRTIINNQGRSGRSLSAVISIVLSIVGFISQFLERLGRSDRLYECQALFGNCKLHELYCWQIKRILFSELSNFLSHNSFYVEKTEISVQRKHLFPNAVVYIYSLLRELKHRIYVKTTTSALKSIRSILK